MVPKLIHQTWRDAEIPERFKAFSVSWLRHHPGWDHRLWTDADLRALVAEREPDFLPVFDGYTRPICRADAGRYILLKHLGGLYVDLDFECFRPLDPLLDGAGLVIGIEPDTHAALEAPRRRSLARILCPSLIASAPGHPFWDAVIATLVASRDAADVLDATGPFLLTRVYEAFPEKSSVRLLSPDLIYPADKTEIGGGRLFDLAAWERATRDAYALHHWDGGWWRPASASAGVPQQFKATVGGPATPRTIASEAMPRVSCLMATRDRPRQAMLAVDCFRRQTYANRELVIVDDSRDDELALRLAGDPLIRVIRPAGGGASLGQARNRAVAEARGPYVCQWDDDDLYDPLRLAAQMTALRSAGARACLLDRWTMWWPSERRVAVSLRRDWEGSLLCEKAALSPYADLARGEDTPVVERLLSEVRTVRLDAPRLYVYVVHGRNTFGTPHFEAHWTHAEPRFEGERALAVERELARRLPLAAYAALGGRRDLADLGEMGTTGPADRPAATAPHSQARSLALSACFGAQLDEANKALASGRPQAARGIFDILRRDWPGRPEGLEGLARAFGQGLDWPRAIDRWDELVVLFPAYRPGALGRARALTELGRFAEAEQVFAAALGAAETRLSALKGLARNAAQAGDWRSALTRWSEILAEAPGDADAIVGRVRALLGLGRSEDAERDTMAADGSLGADDRILLRAMLLQKRHRSDELADLLDGAPEVVARSPSLRSARLNADKSRGRIDAIATVAAGADPDGLTRTVAEAVSVAHATDDNAQGRDKLRRLWQTQGSACLTADLLSATLAAVLDQDGEAEAIRLLQQVDALPLREPRNVKLRLLAAFDRLRLGLATSAADELRRIADGCEARAPLGTWREAVYGLVHRFARLEHHYVDARLDTGWREASARDILDHILAAVAAGHGFSLIRLGDGEGNFLPYPGRHRAIATDDREATQCIWWGQPRLDPRKSEALSRALQQAIRRADIVGIPDLSRLVYSLPVPTPVDLFDSWHDFRGQLAVLHHASIDMESMHPDRLFGHGQRLTSCHIHADLAAFGLYEELFAKLRRVSIIACHPDLPARLHALFGVETRRMITIPHERKAAAAFGYGERGEHWPDAFERLRRDLDVAPGDVVLVAAGFLGKIYADWIKQRGGIALDIGSIVDFWCGFSTRAPHFTQRYKGSQKRSGARPPPAPPPNPAALRSRGAAILAPWAGGSVLPGLTLYAHATDSTGMAIGGQGLAASLAAAGLDHVVADLDTPPSGPAPAARAINIVASNPWILEHDRYWAPRGGLTPASLPGRYNIGVWAWESPTTPPPPSWARALPAFDEIWAPSRYTADCLAATMAIRATVVPHAVEAVAPALGRDRLGLTPGAFLFCFVLDGLSNVERKNPLGAVRAFFRAFPDGGAELILKARNLRRELIDAIMTEAAGRPGVHLRLGTESRAETLGLIAAADAYLSLHRAEGFGLTVAEAMALGKPVIATGYSGNMEFMGEATAYPVRYTLTTTDRPNGDYAAGTTWAEPDIDHAAALMRAVRDDPAEALRRGQAASAHMRQHFSAAAVGARVGARLAEIVADSGAATTRATATPARAAKRPSVLVLTPVRDAARHLPAYRRALEALDHPRDRLSLAFLEGDSRDGTPDLIEGWLPDLDASFARATLLRHSEGLVLDRPRWDGSIQFARRRALARLRNRLLQATLRDEDWVLWLDADVIGYPPDTLGRLLDTGRDIVTPHCVKRPGGRSFDLNTFQSTWPSLAEEQRFLRDGIVQPPKGAGRRYLDALRGTEMVRVDAVGGTMLLIRAELHRFGLNFPAYSHRGYIETEGLAMMARDMGVACWGMPDLEILHADE
ncbi:MAG TPA: glycosyltransferase [Lichenihabitans sp.]|jgi:glycosyltransferase involved in cell wall biosynthesis/tetratricopeptide (TPR) repeat protein|nr:glycosyltransferase [Lichenihabitans sp.]